MNIVRYVIMIEASPDRRGMTRNVSDVPQTGSRPEHQGIFVYSCEHRIRECPSDGTQRLLRRFIRMRGRLSLND